MGVEIQDGRGGLYQRDTVKMDSTPAGGSVAADPETIKN